MKSLDKLIEDLEDLSKLGEDAEPGRVVATVWHDESFSDNPSGIKSKQTTNHFTVTDDDDYDNGAFVVAAFNARETIAEAITLLKKIKENK